ncbi:MAG: MarR family transcriptional regulator [Acidimicrobiales bacterium]
MAGRESSDEQLEQLWSRMMTLFATARDEMFSILAAHGLTPPHGFALKMLHEHPMRMRDMADRMVCDASYITSVVDRLEELGFAERRASTSDRRVKEIALTRSGEKVAHAITRAMGRPPSTIERLSNAELRTLVSLMAKVVPDDEVVVDAFRIPPPRV